MPGCRPKKQRPHKIAQPLFSIRGLFRWSKYRKILIIAIQSAAFSSSDNFDKASLAVN